ncbi:MAG: TRAP transporter substrate-binding protein DctP [Candidatus Bathyarchaeia archaeon]
MKKRLEGVKLGTLVLFVITFAFLFVRLIYATEVVTLKFGTPFSPDHTFSRIDQKWIEKIEQESGGKLKIRPFWGGTIITGASTVDQLASGVVDVAHVAIHMEKTGFDFARSSILFFWKFEPQKAYEVFKSVMLKNPYIEREYRERGIKVIAWTSTTFYQLITKKPVRKLSDLKGMRLRVLGPMGEILKDFGVESVALPASEIYEGLAKGVIEGLYLPAESLKTMRVAEVAKYCTMINIGQGPNAARAINLATYEKLPEELKTVLDKNIDFWTLESIKAFTESDQVGISFGKEQGVEFITMPKEELSRLAEAIEKYNMKIIENLEAKKIPAKKIYNDIVTLAK